MAKSFVLIDNYSKPDLSGSIGQIINGDSRDVAVGGCPDQMPGVFNTANLLVADRAAYPRGDVEWAVKIITKLLQ